MEHTQDLKSHWNKAYDKEDNQLGWFEENPAPTMQLIETCQLEKDAIILNVGVGTTNLIDTLLDEGYTNLIANDLSDFALQKLKNRIKQSHNYDLKIITDDLTNPSELQDLKNVNLWIDRAVLHFFLKEEEQTAYFNLIKKIVNKDGFVLIAVFSLDGAEKCCGLDLKRYNLDTLKDALGTDFKLIDSFNHTFINPFGGERPYVYTLFQKI
ncbi:methyltransferase domain-containing protein [Xanthomarina sp. F2636L]|uniref:methyltransferase domain-containing protein n=1 Tax=Xanthomarina sp. F2636L TaxID=2996018 RepID=UPI00225E6C99|nr:methyltransferase domain-containing protein [Xanthomarina sp. F2636L]MCX7551511.1 methyltransferase domain-containing protein [Xanthomarina sp. F2636L]